MAHDPLRPAGFDKGKPLVPAAPPQKPATPVVTPPKPTAATVPLKPEPPRRPVVLAGDVNEVRLASLDAYRGFIMLMMASAGFGLANVLQRLKDAGITEEAREFRVVRFFAGQFEHVLWQGGVFWDLIQPAFMFMVGVALPYSFMKRAMRGDSYVSQLLHTLIRCLALVALGVFLNNPDGGKGPYTIYSFVNVLTQIGLGYWFVFLLVNRGVWVQGAAVALILGGTWYAFFQHPLPPEGFDYASVGVVNDEHRDEFVLPGIRGHWSKNTNFAASADQKFLNKFPRAMPVRREKGELELDYLARVEASSPKSRFEFNPGGYATLNFVPSIATMLMGLMIGELLRTRRKSGRKVVVMLAAGAVCLALGAALHFAGLCPIVKRIWTPSWALASGGLVIWMLALFYLVFDHWGWRRLAWPLAIVGMNSIVVYMMSQLLKPWTLRVLYTHLTLPYAMFTDRLSERVGKSYSPALFGGAGDPYQPLYESLAVLAAFWLVCLWLWRQRLFVRL
ncbi:MAG: hypothetical protein C0483_21785 [Pirellula sp.]|nr:hypothetical protein [Pirellula sp.]